MKQLYLFLLVSFISVLTYGQSVFINEIHYDNSGTDVNEGVEIAGPAGTDVTGYQIIPYNGSGGASYTPVGIFSGTIPDQQNGYGTLWVAISGLQNGAPDGLALVDNNGTVIQFLSYEGSLTATNGPANGLTSTDIGVSEGSNDAGTSLQLQGTGDNYLNFTWTSAPITATPGTVNTGQTLVTVNEPALTITSPADNTIFNPEITSVNIAFNVVDFTVANSSGDGYIKYTLDSETPVNKYDTNALDLTGLASGDHTLYMELVDNSGVVLSPEVNATVHFNIAVYTTVSNLAELRTGTIGKYYHVTGEIIGTFAQTSNNQKWAQDATAGIMIHDPDGVIATVYNLGDGVTGLKGQLGSYGSVLQVIPTTDPGTATSTGNVVTPVVVTLADFAAAIDMYESELIKVIDVTVSDLASGGNGTFLASKNYPISDISGSGVLRTNFISADYIGETLPQYPLSYLIGIAGEYNTSAQIYPRSMGDMTLGTKDYNQIKGFSMYPNPVSNQLFIHTEADLSKNVQIFDLLGKQVLNRTIEGSSLDLNIPAGIYMIKVEEAGKVTSQKLVVK